MILREVGTRIKLKIEPRNFFADSPFIYNRLPLERWCSQRKRWEKNHCATQPQFDKTGFNCFTAHERGGGLDSTRRWEKYHCTAQPQFDKTGFSCFTAHTKTTYFLFWWNAVMPSLRQAVQWYFYQRVLWTHLSLPVDCKWLLHCRLKTTYFLVFGEILSCQTWSKLYSDPSTNSECFLLGHGAL